MARLDIRVDGRTRFSRTVDDAVVNGVLAAAVNGPRTVKRNFGGKVVAEFDEATGKRKAKPRKRIPEKASDESGQADATGPHSPMA